MMRTRSGWVICKIGGDNMALFDAIRQQAGLDDAAYTSLVALAQSGPTGMFEASSITSAS